MLFLAPALFVAGAHFAGATGIDLDLARSVLAEAKSLADKDGGRLWGRRLSGPLLIVDPDSRESVANQADANGMLKAAKGAFVGRYPKDAVVANTAIQWSGVFWTMVLWPLPNDPVDRACILMHESFHRVQPELHWPRETPECSHMGELEARILLQLEYRALAKALSTTKDEQKAHIRSALAFRVQRWAAFPQAEKAERALELAEGLAEYTGLKLGYPSDGTARKALAARLKAHEGAESYSRSFAYDTGPAYALVLDQVGSGWRKALTRDWDLSGIVARKVKTDLKPLAGTALDALAKQYGGDEIRDRETKSAREREAVREGHRKRLVVGPNLRLSLRRPQVQFNPSNLIALGEDGTVYPTMTVVDEWGSLTVSSGGALMKDWMTVTVSAPIRIGPDLLVGEGWTLKLNPGWKTAPGKRAGDLLLVRQ